MNTDQRHLDHEMQLQADAERAERERLPAGGDSRVDRYRMVVRALRQPLEPQLPADFAVRVAAKAERGDRDLFGNAVVWLLLIAMGVVMLPSLVPALAKAVQVTVSKPLPLLPGHQLVMAAVCIGVVWAIERGWMRVHPTASHLR